MITADPPSMILATWITQETSRVLGTDTFVAMLPASEHDGPVRALMVQDTSGIRSGRGSSSTGIVDVQHNGIQLLNRDLSYANNWLFMSDMRNRFNALKAAPVTIGANNYTIGTAIVVSGPVNVGFDDTTNASLLSLNLLITIGSN